MENWSLPESSSATNLLLHLQITIFNQPGYGLGDPIGLGDMDFSIKYRFHEEKKVRVFPPSPPA